MEQLQTGFLNAFGMAFDVTQPGATNTINLCTAALPSGAAPCTAFDLDLLATPHAIEHDGSMRSQDKGEFNGTGDNVHFNATIFAQTQAIIAGASHVNYSLAETIRLRRFEQMEAVDDPGWFQENDGGSLTEQAFYLSAMSDPAEGDPTTGNARVDWLSYWFGRHLSPFQSLSEPTHGVTSHVCCSLTPGTQRTPVYPPISDG